MPLSVQHPVAAGDDLRDLAGGASPSAASLVDVRKEFGGVVALAHASFGLRAGEVLALLGENGAGKSTCVKMLAGVHRPDSGSIRLDGHDVVLRSPHDALARGIAVMHQHPGLFPDLSVAENIAIGHMPLTGLRQLDQKRIEAQCDAAAAGRRPRLCAGPSAGAAAQLRTATRGSRARAVRRGARADHGRADRLAVARRGRAAVRGGRATEAARRGDDVRRPPHGGDLPHRRPRGGAARRPPGRHGADRRDASGRGGDADGRPQARNAISRPG